MTAKVKYCLCKGIQIVPSEFNNYGKCVCLDCTKEKCDRENCETAQHRRNWGDMMQTALGITSWCEACIGVNEK